MISFTKKFIKKLNSSRDMYPFVEKLEKSSNFKYTVGSTMLQGSVIIKIPLSLLLNIINKVECNFFVYIPKGEFPEYIHGEYFYKNYIFGYDADYFYKTSILEHSKLNRISESMSKYISKRISTIHSSIINSKEDGVFFNFRILFLENFIRNENPDEIAIKACKLLYNLLLDPNYELTE